MGISPNVVSYTSLIQGLCYWSKWEEATDLIGEMVDQHVHPNVVTYRNTVKAAELLELMIQRGVNPDMVNTLISELCKNGKMDKANELFELMIEKCEKPNTVAYNTLIDGLCLTDRIDNAWKLFVSKTNNGCRHNVITYNATREMISKGVVPNVVTYNTLLSGLFRVGKIKLAKELYYEIQLNNVMPDEYTYNILIDRFYKNGCVTKAIEIPHTLINGKFSLSIVSYSFTWKIFHKLSQEGLKPNIITYTIMINGLCKERQLEEANNLLSIIEKKKKGCAPNVITYNTLMHGFFQNSATTKVVELLHKMAKRNIMPNTSTTSIIINLLVNNEKYL
ncbi:hypothetical protein ACOSQ3_022279 [Xanthoceras sorbifolium]